MVHIKKKNLKKKKEIKLYLLAFPLDSELF